MSIRRIAVTGMAINTALSDTLEDFLSALREGKSSITRWKAYDTDKIYSKVGGDLYGYDTSAKLKRLKNGIPDDLYARLRHFVRRSPWSTKLSTLVATDAWLNAGIAGTKLDNSLLSVVVSGHNLNSGYVWENSAVFDQEPDYIDSKFALHALDSDHAGSVSEVLQAKGPIYTIGSACASGNAAMRCAIDEIRHHGIKAVMVVGAALNFSPVDLHAMALMGAISFENFNDNPAQASRPYDMRREGFVPAHGAAAILLEDMEFARMRGARIRAEVLGVESRSDGNHLPFPSEDGQAAAMQLALENSGVSPEQIGFICAHATSTPLGDITEIQAIKRVFGDHAHKVKINAPKSMLGHTCWSAAIVEAVAAILQMQSNQLHPSINIDELDLKVDLDVCANRAQPHEFDYMLNNSFGFGGINCVSIFKRYDA